jgi:membrane-associated phospholipid phosphatase
MVSIAVQSSKTNQKATGELRSPDLFAKRPLIGLFMFLLGSLLFGIIAYYVNMQGQLSRWDLDLANRMHTAALQSPLWMKDLMIGGFYVGLHGYIVIGVLLGLYFIFKKFWKEVTLVAVCFAGEGVLWLSLANLFDRTRPHFETNIGGVLNYPSFPSGHTISGVLAFGLLAYLMVPKISSNFWKAAIIIFSLLMMFYIGYSRFFMGAHYLTDIIAGYAIGIAWFGLVFTSIEILCKKGSLTDAKKNQIHESKINR